MLCPPEMLIQKKFKVNASFQGGVQYQLRLPFYQQTLDLFEGLHGRLQEVCAPVRYKPLLYSLQLYQA